LGLGELASLELLDLSFNKLSGVVPTSIKNLLLLNSLYLYKNDLTGSIPSCLGELTSMLYLDLSFNKFSGMVPTSLGNLTSLEFLDLSDNQLTGNIPKEINLLTNLQVKQF
jgi:Leucine-rich repeat (LRR) protein